MIRAIIIGPPMPPIAGAAPPAVRGVDSCHSTDEPADAVGSMPRSIMPWPRDR
jgi:hypothetical protein